MVGFRLVSTEPIMNLERKIDMKEKKKMGRPKGELPPMISTSMRLPLDLIEGFKKKHPQGWHKAMREVLTNYLKRGSK